jgi:hypothetical protein
MARAQPKPRPVADDDEPEVYSTEWVAMIHYKANQDLKRQRRIASLKPLRCGCQVQHIHVFEDAERIAIAMTTAAGTVTLVLDRSQADTLAGGLNRLLDHGCNRCSSQPA